MRKILILCAVIALVTANAFAGTITFKSGKKVEGIIKAITNDSITVDLYGVTDMTYDLSGIQEINGQTVELKPTAAAPAGPSEITVNPPAEVTKTTPETQASPVETVETAPISDEIFRGVKAPAIEPTAIEPKETKAAIAVITAFFGIILIIFAVLYVYSAICLQMIAKKTGAENGWMAWIPVANLFLMCNIGYVRYIWLLLLLAGFVPLIGSLLGPICDLLLFGFIWYKIALARGKQGWIGAVTVIPVVGFFTMGYLAFSKKEEGAAPAPNIGGGQPANPLGTAPTYKPPIE